VELKDRLVLLTGASSGLGPVIARRLAKDGARFILSARRERELAALAHELGGARVITADLSRPGEAERLADEAGPVDVLVANAGLPATGRLVSFSPSEIDNALNVNLRSVMVLARCLLPSMLERRSGHLVFMSSIAGRMPAPGASVYNATKFGVRGFGLALRQELDGTGVRASVVLPTFVSDQGMWAETGVKAHPMAGEVKPESVADAVHSAITRNRAEIDVAPVTTKASLKVAALAPRMAERVARIAGASDVGDVVADRQKHKR
jgi:short-subunit dehydrogenase